MALTNIIIVIKIIIIINKIKINRVDSILLRNKFLTRVSPKLPK